MHENPASEEVVESLYFLEVVRLDGLPPAGKPKDPLKASVVEEDLIPDGKLLNEHHERVLQNSLVRLNRLPPVEREHGMLVREIQLHPALKRNSAHMIPDRRLQLENPANRLHPDLLVKAYHKVTDFDVLNRLDAPIGHQNGCSGWKARPSAFVVHEDALREIIQYVREPEVVGQNILSNAVRCDRLHPLPTPSLPHKMHSDSELSGRPPVVFFS